MEKIPTKMLWLSNKFNRCNPIPDAPAEAPGTTVSWTLKFLNSKFSQIQSYGIKLDSDKFTLEELVFFASRSAKNLYLQDCIIEYENGQLVQLETIVAQFPSLRYFWYKCQPDGSDISTNAVKELLSNPSFSNMIAFHFLEIPDTFDIDSFYTYLKSRDDFYCRLHFLDDIADDYHERLQIIIDELLSTESTSFWFPRLYVPNLHADTQKAMMKRAEEDFKAHMVD